jgi:malate dehydrogenase
MDISIVGAGGTIGRQIAIGLAYHSLLPATGRLQLVGNAGGSSEKILPGIAADLADAFAEDLPEIDLAFSSEEILGDIIIIAAGRTTGVDGPANRSELAAINVPLVENIARSIARNGHGEELVLVLTNPVEACVAACCRHLDRKRVIGMGAYLDTLRFRREIAAELGVRRQRVQGLVLGEHGLRMVPCWSTVDVYGYASPDGRARLAALQRPHDPDPAAAAQEINALVREKGALAAYARVAKFGPALRAIVKTNITQLSGARTPAGTAEMILRLLSTLVSGSRVLTAAQIRLEGEFLGIHGVVGAPIVMTVNGVDNVVNYELTPAEQIAVLAAVHREEQPSVPSAKPNPQTGGSAPVARDYRCVLDMHTVARPGILEKITAIFADRGINLTEAHATPNPQITLHFAASEVVKDYLAKRLLRVPEVRSVKFS